MEMILKRVNQMLIMFKMGIFLLLDQMVYGITYTGQK